jgi:hypothetical protein
MELLLITILFILCGLFIYSSINLYKKIIFYEDKIVDIQEKVTQTLETMRMIDLSGAFESDDEVGDVFNQMKNLIEDIGEFIYEEEKK